MSRQLDRSIAEMHLLIQKADALKKSNPKKALEIIFKVLRSGKKNPYAIGIGTECLINLQSYSEALGWAQQNVKLSGNEVSYGLLYLAYTFLGEFGKALQAAEKSAELAPGSEIARRQLRRAILQKKAGARIEHERVAEEIDKNSFLLCQEAWKKMHAKKYEDALDLILEACDLLPSQKNQTLLSEILRLKQRAEKKK